MHIRKESQPSTERRLRSVLRASTIDVLKGAYSFREFESKKGPPRPERDALALVRDGTSWSVLAPSPTGTESFAVFCIHFPAGRDNSGFVGWLASRLKRRFGTGVFVVCGQNSAAGGIFDYWGVPVALREQVRAELARLRLGHGPTRGTRPVKRFIPR